MRQSLRLNIQLVEQYVATNKQALDVQTDTLSAGQTAYNPYATGAPLTLYATGIRNAYDLIWDSNGPSVRPHQRLCRGGNIPATPAGVTPSARPKTMCRRPKMIICTTSSPVVTTGILIPARGQYIFGGGNPTTPAADDAIQTAYPSAQIPIRITGDML